MRINAWALTDVGRKRDHNEDAYLLKPEVGLFAVADGMGGHQAGEQASRIALEVLDRELTVASLELPPESSEPAPAVAVRKGTQAAGAAIYEAAQADEHLHGMGTTLVSLLIRRGKAYIGHVGDSRCYLYRDGRCVQLTEDHSWVNEQVRAGRITEEEAKTSKFKNIITRSVGFEKMVQVDNYSVAVEAGDCFLMCSDGLSNLVEMEEIARVLGSHLYKDCPKFLVDLANDRGGDDNVTVVVVHAANDAAR